MFKKKRKRVEVWAPHSADISGDGAMVLPMVFGWNRKEGGFCLADLPLFYSFDQIDFLGIILFVPIGVPGW